jgi:hypothetical protein
VIDLHSTASAESATTFRVQTAEPSYFLKAYLAGPCGTGDADFLHVSEGGKGVSLYTPADSSRVEHVATIRSRVTFAIGTGVQ